MTRSEPPPPGRASRRANRFDPDLATVAGAPGRSILKGDLPEEILRRYLVERDGLGGTHRFYRDHRSEEPAFSDRGHSLQADHAYPDTVSSLLKIAAHRGWSRIKVHGDETFRREVWIQARTKGLEVSGYEPRDRDRQAAGLPREADATRDRLHRITAVVRHLIADDTARARLLEHARLRIGLPERAKDRGL